jgi:Tfp pilus assembly protein PilN
MFESINFLRERVRVQEAVVQSDKKIALFTSIGLGVFLSLVVGVVGYSFFLQSKLQALEQTQQQLDARLQSLSGVSKKYSTRASLISLAKLVVEKRTKAWDAITYLYTIIPKDSQIESINLSSQDESLSFTVRAPNVFSYTSLSTLLQSNQVVTSGYKPSLGTLTRHEDGSYSLEVQLFISQAKKATPAPVSSGTENL